MRGFLLGWVSLWFLSNICYAGYVQNLFYPPEQLVLGLTTFLFGGWYGYVTRMAVISYNSNKNRLAGRWMLIGSLASSPLFALYPYLYQEIPNGLKIDPASALPCIWGSSLIVVGLMLSFLRDQ